MTSKRFWVGKTYFKGPEPFTLGTVVAESELEAERKLFALWRKIMPYPPPRTFTVVPGLLVFQEEKDDQG